MEIYLYLILIWFGVDATKVSAPTPEVIALVKDLGNDTFEVREKAQEKLQKKGLSIYRYLEKVSKEDRDFEKKRRCAKIIWPMLRCQSEDEDIYTPCIYSLPNRIRFPLGWVRLDGQNWVSFYHQNWFWTPLDISTIYYDRALVIYNKDIQNDDDKICTYDSVEVSTVATNLLVEDLLRTGWRWRTTQNFLNKMAWTQKNTYHDYKGHYGWASKPPPPRSSSQ